jgi:hypothetical protein
VVIVQSHLLRDKGSVRLRHVTGDGTTDSSGSSNNERFVELENLAFTIREMLSQLSAGEDGTPEDHHRMIENSSATLSSSTSTKEATRSGTLKPSMDCIYVDHDQYYESSRIVGKAETPHWKVVIRTMKIIMQKGEQFVSGIVDPSIVDAGETLPMFAVSEISFWALREFGTCLMKRGCHERSAVGACREVTDAYPNFKRIIKTLGSAIENFMKRNGYWSTTTNTSVPASGHHRMPSQNRQGLVNLLLYTRSDDRFDLISLETYHQQDNTNETGRNARRK